MASVNKVILIGNVGNDPTIRVTPDGTTMAAFNVATTDKWKDKATGESREATEWHRVTFFGRTAEVVRDYVKKGSALYVEGKLKTRKYTDKDGLERQVTEVNGDVMQFVGKRSESGEAPAPAPRPAPAAAAAPAPRPAPKTTHLPPDFDDDIPF